MNVRKPATLAATAAIAVSLAGFATSASASVTISKLQVWSSGSVVTSITVDAAHNPTSVTVKLDSHCLNAYTNGRGYGIAAVSASPASVTVSPASVSGLHCSSAGQTFNLTGLKNDTTNIRFDPVAEAPGLQKKLAGVTLNVHVINASTSDTAPPPAHKRPAAPAVANAYLDNATLVSHCKTAYASAGHHWRGALISAVAHWSAQNKLSTKKDTSAYTDTTWTQFVQGKVDSLCHYTPTT